MPVKSDLDFLHTEKSHFNKKIYKDKKILLTNLFNNFEDEIKKEFKAFPYKIFKHLKYGIVTALISHKDSFILISKHFKEDNKKNIINFNKNANFSVRKSQFYFFDSQVKINVYTDKNDLQIEFLNLLNQKNVNF